MPAISVSISFNRMTRAACSARSAATIALLLLATNATPAYAQNLEVNSGTTTISNSQNYTTTTVARNPANIATLEVTAAGSLNNSGELYVGNFGTGTLLIGGGSVTSGTGYLGADFGGVGTATVSSGMWDSGDELYVGLIGTGTLNVNGGSVTNSDGFLGYDVSGVGTATVSSGTWNTPALLYVGVEGTGTLNVNGGSVTSGIGYLGFRFGGVGTATVSSGRWDSEAWLTVGFGGTGTLNVNGGSVTSGTGYLAVDFGGVGTATVSSGMWDSGDELYVGLIGTGTLNVTGGSVTNKTSYLGYHGGSVGSVTVSSGAWANSGDLVVGAEGVGSLTMNGGLVTVGGTLSKNAASTINLNAGGTLQIGTGGTTGSMTTDLVNGGTLIFNRSDASTYSAVISGTGVLVKQGAGALTLAGANSYSGRTTISDGTLALSGSASIGTGGLDLGTNGIFDLAALAAGTSTLPATGNLSGAGKLSGDGKTLAVLGSFLPGNSPGTVTLGTGFTLDLSSSGTSVFEITSPLYTPGTFDLVNGNGSMIFGGVLNLAFSGGSYADGTDVLQLFANTGGFSGDFTSVVSTGLAAGQFATFNASTGYVSVVPEPSTYAMALAGLACGGWQMWRRRRLRQVHTLAA